MSEKINIQKLTENRTIEQYPNVLITKPVEVLPMLISALEKGDMQLVVEWKGQKKVVAKISSSAYNFHKLLRILDSVEYVMAKDIKVHISSVTDYLDCIAKE